MWVLGPATSSLVNFIAGLIVVILRHIGLGMAKLVLLVVLSLVVLMVVIEVLECNLVQTRLMEDFGHIGRIAHYTPLLSLGLNTTELVMMVILCLVLVMVMIDIVWIVLPPTSPSLKLIFVVVVMILIHLGVR